MIRVQRAKNRITIAGHAGYAESGRDIVCAAVSVLTYNLQESIEKLTDDEVGFSFFEDEVVIEYGKVSHTAKVLIDSFIVGIKLISSNYSDYVEFVQA